MVHYNQHIQQSVWVAWTYNHFNLLSNGRPITDTRWPVLKIILGIVGPNWYIKSRNNKKTWERSWWIFCPTLEVMSSPIRVQLHCLMLTNLYKWVARFFILFFFNACLSFFPSFLHSVMRWTTLFCTSFYSMIYFNMYNKTLVIQNYLNILQCSNFDKLIVFLIYIIVSSILKYNETTNGVGHISIMSSS